MLNLNMKLFVGGLIVLTLLTAGGIFWYQKQSLTNTDTEPVRIYKATPLKREETPVVKTTEVDVSDKGQTTTADSDTPDVKWHNGEPLNETNPPLPEMSREPDPLTDEPSDEFTEAIKNPEQIAEELLEEWTDFFEDLRYKYPLLSMSTDEIMELSQLPGGTREIRAQALAMSNDAIDYLVNWLSRYTPEETEELLRQAEELGRQENYGIPPEYLQQAFERVRERLK